eukprot:SAG31_NODE_2888_length_4948_cov_2.055475_4_plen_58_part_00
MWMSVYHVRVNMVESAQIKSIHILVDALQDGPVHDAKWIQMNVKVSLVLITAHASME